MPPEAPVSPAISAKIIHAALMLGVILFYAVAWYVGTKTSMPISAVPNRRVLYVGLFLVSATVFGAAAYSASRLTPAAPGTSQDDWWRANLGRAIVVWSLIEAPTLLGTIAYLLTHDFRSLIATFAGLLFFVNYRPSRLAEG
jgi:hypothetical protein